MNLGDLWTNSAVPAAD